MTILLEVELASCAVGARNFPAFGPKGEEAFRGAFASAFQNELQVSVPENAVIVDLGCGTGMSTRPLARMYPQAKQIIGNKNYQKNLLNKKPSLVKQFFIKKKNLMSN